MISFAIATVCVVFFGCMSMRTPAERQPVVQVQPEIFPDRALTGSEEVVHVFIHGSTHVQLALLSPFQVFFSHLQGNSWYERTHQILRSKQSTMQGGMVLEQGVTDLTELVCSEEVFPASVQSKAAYHIVRVFHQYTAQKQGQRYLAFGWSGMMCDKERTLAAEQLYTFLASYKQQRVAQGVAVRFHLYAFSHGGQIALRLPLIRAERCDDEMIIELLVLSAVPLYYDTARSILLGMFKQVMNLYSPGDTIQTLDSFTTATDRCYQTIAEVLPLSRFYDVRMSDVAVTINHRYFPHHKSFFDLHCTALYPCRSRRSEQYRMRYVSAYHFIEHVNPFPLLVLYPQILPLLEQLQQDVYEQWTIDCTGCAEQIRVSILQNQEQKAHRIISPARLQQARTQLVAAFDGQKIASQWDLTLTELLCAAQTLFA